MIKEAEDDGEGEYYGYGIFRGQRVLQQNIVAVTNATKIKDARKRAVPVNRLLPNVKSNMASHILTDQ